MDDAAQGDALPFAQELAEILQALGLSQAEFAARLGYHPVHMNKILHGEKRATARLMHAARLLLADRATQLGETPAPYPPPGPEAVGIRVEPARSCGWAVLGQCGGHYWRFKATITKEEYLQGDACTTHLYQLYSLLIEELRKEVTVQEKKRKRARRQDNLASLRPQHKEGNGPTTKES